MCLRIRTKPNIFKRLWYSCIRRGAYIECYKVVTLDANTIISPIYREFVWQPGWNISGRKSKKLTKNEKLWNEIRESIHVYINDSFTGRHLYDIRSCNKKGISIKVICYLKDLVAYGTYDATFTKVYLDTEEYKRALMELQNENTNGTR